MNECNTRFIHIIILLLTFSCHDSTISLFYISLSIRPNITKTIFDTDL